MSDKTREQLAAEKRHRWHNDPDYRERARESARRYRESRDPVARKAYRRAYYEAHREETIEKQGIYYRANRERYRLQYIERKYGISADEYAAIYDRQRGLCAICERPERLTNGGPVVMELAVDHDHETGRVRGLLCVGCNTSLGGFNDDPALLTRAMEYLR